MIRTEDYKLELISIFFAQKHLIFWTAFLIFAGAVAMALFWPATYAATGSVLLTDKQVEDKEQRALRDAETRAFSITKEEIASEVEILSSPQTIQNALASLAAKYPTLGAPGQGGMIAQVNDVKSNMKIKVVPATNVIEVRYLSRNPAMAVDVLTAVMNEYIVQRGQLYARQPPTPAKLFTDEAERYREGVRAKDNELVAILQESGASNPKIEIEENIKLKNALERDLNTLKKERIDVKLTIDRYDNALKGSDLQYFAFVENLTIKDIGLQLAGLVKERGDLLRVYQPQHEVVTVLDEQISDSMARLGKEVVLVKEGFTKKLQALEAQIESIEAQISWYDDKNLTMAEQLIGTERIMQESEVMKSSYETYAKRADEVAINNALASSEPSISAKIIGSAFPSKGPVFPKRNTILPLGLLVGLLVGCSLGFVREYFDHTFKRPSDVATYAGLPVLFSLPAPSNRILDMLYSIVIAALIIGTGIFVAMNF